MRRQECGSNAMVTVQMTELYNCFLEKRYPEEWDVDWRENTHIDRRKRVAMENQNIKKRVRRLVKSMDWEVQPSCTWCRHSFATNLTHAGVPHNYISESMGHSVDSNITNRYIDAFPLAQQMEFNSRLLKLNDDADIMEELKGLTPEQLKALIAMVKNV